MCECGLQPKIWLRLVATHPQRSRYAIEVHRRHFSDRGLLDSMGRRSGPPHGSRTFRELIDQVPCFIEDGSQ